MSYDRFVDERLLSSRDALNKFQIKMKVLDFDENARDFSQRVWTAIVGEENPANNKTHPNRRN